MKLTKSQRILIKAGRIVEAYRHDLKLSRTDELHKVVIAPMLEDARSMLQETLKEAALAADEEEKNRPMIEPQYKVVESYGNNRPKEYAVVHSLDWFTDLARFSTYKEAEDECKRLNDKHKNNRPMSTYEVYNSGDEIGVLFKESAEEYYRYPLEYQGSIEDTYDLAQRACDILNAFRIDHPTMPECLDQFIEERSRHKPSREEYLTDLRLFLQFGLPSTCGQCRFFLGDRPCKHEYPTASPRADSYPCTCGIRKEHDND